MDFMPAKRLGFGCMRLPITDASDQTSIDMPQFERMVDEFLDRGFTYFDTAWMYHAHQSEVALREALVRRHPRDSFTIATKMPTMMLKQPADQEAIFAEQLSKLGVDRFDYYLAHNINAVTWQVARDFGTFEFIARQKAEGRVAHMGFSFHDTPELLDEVLTACPEVDFVQLQINYLDWNSEGIQSRRCWEVARSHGKPVVVMEPVKGGRLADLPHDAALELSRLTPVGEPVPSLASYAVRFAASFEGVLCVLSGMSDMAQLEDNTSYMRDFEPLSDAERAALTRVVRILRQNPTIPCTACRYCVAGCPCHIPIPNYFALYNEAKAGEGSTPKAYYENMSRTCAPASACVGCRRCVTACPQHIQVPEMLAEVAKAFEG
jgi:predicted aldo/keto reductase-like oxidoreductase